MEPKLQTFHGCVLDIHLFELWDHSTKSDGRFVSYSAMDCKPHHFMWVSNGSHHRLDGPAVIWRNGDICWFIAGMEINVKSQTEFEKWIYNNS